MALDSPASLYGSRFDILVNSKVNSTYNGTTEVTPTVNRAKSKLIILDYEAKNITNDTIDTKLADILIINLSLFKDITSTNNFLTLYNTLHKESLLNGYFSKWQVEFILYNDNDTIFRASKLIPTTYNVGQSSYTETKQDITTSFEFEVIINYMNNDASL